jgi:hypothetical protein
LYPGTIVHHGGAGFVFQRHGSSWMKIFSAIRTHEALQGLSSYQFAADSGFFLFTFEWTQIGDG